jgi:hypothetical protein
MRVPCQLGLALVLAVPSAGPASAGRTPSRDARRQAKPDVRKAKPLPRWANAKDLARLKSVEGKPAWRVIEVLGHPSKVQRKADGSEVWDYPWVASCRVWIEKGRVTATRYEAGY